MLKTDAFLPLDELNFNRQELIVIDGAALLDFPLE
jgi:hypothetical protein